MEEADTEGMESRYRLATGLERVKIVVIWEAITCDSLQETDKAKGHSKESTTE